MSLRIFMVVADLVPVFYTPASFESAPKESCVLLILVAKRVGRRDPDNVAGCRAFPVFVDYVGSIFGVGIPGSSPLVLDCFPKAETHGYQPLFSLPVV